jgi:tetratricopeptide (TPR) repeat protein
MTQQEIATLEKKVGEHAHSPLFAMLAQQYLAAGRSQEALKLCDAGLANFPFFTTGHLVKGKSLVALNLIAEARREFEFVLEFLPDNTAVAALLASVPPGSDETLTAEVPAEQQSLREPISPVPSQEAALPLSAPPDPYPEQINYPAYAAPSAPPESDFGFGISTPQPETQFGLPETTSAPLNPFDAMTQFTQASAAPSSPDASEEDPFGFAAVNSDEPGRSVPSFDFLPDTSGSPQAPEAIAFTAPLSPEEIASFDIYAARKKNELTGTDTLSFEDFKKPALQASPPASVEAASSDFSQDNIGEFAEKLQNVQRMTPVINFAEKDTPALSPEESTSSMGFVTPTLAEIYAKQGWYDDAIKAYKTLAQSKPAEREKFEKRVTEIEEIKKKAAQNIKPS